MDKGVIFYVDLSRVVLNKRILKFSDCDPLSSHGSCLWLGSSVVRVLARMVCEGSWVRVPAGHVLFSRVTFAVPVASISYVIQPLF